MRNTPKPYEAIDFPPLTEEEEAVVKGLQEMEDSEIDTSEMTECKGTGGLYYYTSLKLPKTDVHAKIDNDTLAWLKKAGKGYQARMNNVLRWARMHNCPIAQM